MHKHHHLTALSTAIALILSNNLFAGDETQSLPSLMVDETSLLDGQFVSQQALTERKAQTNDTASLLDGENGYSTQKAGGVSNLPVIHGLADERVKVDIDGMGITSACANHMNSPMSYIAPASVGKVTVYSGGTVPVSVGGDSIAGTVKIESIPPKFAKKGETLTGGSVTVGGRSNGNAVSGNADVFYADQTTNLSYTKTYSHADNYQSASSFKAGDGKYTNTVGTSLYEIHTDTVKLAKKVGSDLYTFSVGRQYIPYQGYPNQYMDMTHNDSIMINAGYLGQFSWGLLDARIFHQNTEHVMNFIDTKYSATNPQGMPMNTKGTDMGYVVKGIIPLTNGHTLTLGNELHKQELDDWWPASGNMMMPGMNPYTYWNINGGTRDRFGTFAELETKHNDQWTTLIGLRHERVTTDTGSVVGYYGTLDGTVTSLTTATGMPFGEKMVNMPYANAFNASDRSRTDDNIDFTAAAKYLADKTSSYEFGFARKTRSPSLYERYSWGRTGMDMKMIGWYGDGNGYLGNPDLKPEVANTLSITGKWNDSAKEDWQVSATPYVSYVENYIDADKCGSIAVGTLPNGNLCTLNTGSSTAGSGSVIGLKFANHDALLYGIDVSAKKSLGQLSSGKYTLLTSINYVRGTILDTNANRDSNIYNIMPLSTKIALQHQQGKWHNAVELQFVAAKSDVDSTRNEFKTPDYKLVNLRTGYDWGQYRVDAGVENVFDEMYFLPTGGAMLAPSVSGGGKAPYSAVAGMGRSLYVSGTMKF